MTRDGDFFLKDYCSVSVYEYALLADEVERTGQHYFFNILSSFGHFTRTESVIYTDSILFDDGALVQVFADKMS